jgi:hypothetical protein
MTSHIQRDQPMVFDQARVHLSTPLEPTLRSTVDEDNRTTLWIPRLHDMQLDTTTACDSMNLHRVLTSKMLPIAPPRPLSSQSHKFYTGAEAVDVISRPENSGIVGNPQVNRIFILTWRKNRLLLNCLK